MRTQLVCVREHKSLDTSVEGQAFNFWGRRQLACQSLAVYDKGSVYYTNGRSLVTVRQLGCGPDRMPTQVGLQAHATRVAMASARQQALRKRIFFYAPLLDRPLCLARLSWPSRS